MATYKKNDHDQKKMIKNSKDDRQQYQRLQLGRTTRTAMDDNNQQYAILHSYLCHHHKGNLLQQMQVD